MAFQKRKREEFNVAFLDVMSCGLGAVILVFMLVKFKTELPEEMSGALSAELAQLQNQNQQASQSLSKLQMQASAQSADIENLAAQLQSIQSGIVSQKARNETLEKQAANLSKEGESSPISPDAPVPVSGKRLQNYLLGLKVEGKKIVMLIDSSASMMDERLIDIIKYKISSPAQKSKAPKWRRTERILEWLVARVPSGSDYMVFRFAEKAKAVGGTGWKKGADPADAAAVKLDFARVVPGGGTDLGAAVEMMRREAKGFTDVYVVTDGLPTKGDKKLSRFFAGCASLVGKSATISGECRAKLLDRIVSNYRERAKVNVVLLPLEGDPFAAPAFWQWTARTHGLLISPEASWP